MPYLTPDEYPTDKTCRVLFFPNGTEWVAIVEGAILELAEEYNFEAFGSVTPSECADEFYGMYLRMLRESNCLRVGDYIFSATQDRAGNVLLCDGAAYDKADYPKLFDAIGYTYGGAGDNFNVPDFSQRFPIGCDASLPAGSTGGEAAHTLTIDEIPAHSHASHAHPTPGVTGVEALPVAGAEIVAQTGSVGGGQAHNNLPPFVAIFVYIVSDV